MSQTENKRRNMRTRLIQRVPRAASDLGIRIGLVSGVVGAVLLSQLAMPGPARCETSTRTITLIHQRNMQRGRRADSALGTAGEVTVRVRRLGAVDTSATIRGQEVDQLVHRGERGTVDPRPPLSFAVDQTGALEFLQMKRKRRGWQPEHASNGPGRQALGTGLYEYPKHIQASFLCQGGESTDRNLFFHISNAIEIYK